MDDGDFSESDMEIYYWNFIINGENTPCTFQFVVDKSDNFTYESDAILTETDSFAVLDEDQYVYYDSSGLLNAEIIGDSISLSLAEQ